MRNNAKKMGESIIRDFHSVMKALKIETGSLDEKIIGEYIDTWYQYIGEKTPALKSVIDNLDVTLTPIQRQGIDYCKKVHSMMEFMEKEYRY